jgi:phage tail sheath protein FI
VLAPGRTTSAGQLQVIDHAQKRGRFALLDAPDTASDATIVAAAQALYVAPNNGRRWCQMFAPWDIIPGITANSTRTVAPSARAAAQYARVDALGNPNQAAAGRNGVARFTVDLSQAAWTDAQRLNLNNAGVTVSRRRFGNAIQTFGMRTLADQALDANWSMAPNVRTVMAYVARARVVGDAHEFDQIDGQGRTISAFRGELMGLANDLFLAGALFGATPAEAFYVETGPAVNTPTTIAAGELHAQVNMRISPSAEVVKIDVVKIPVNQSI